MAPEVVERAAEPIFTTRAVGKGTGLDLSMLYGFVEQSGGHLKVPSKRGAGTTVRLYLPRAAGAGEAATVLPAASFRAAARRFWSSKTKRSSASSSSRI
jgi:hypothetical protein